MKKIGLVIILVMLMIVPATAQITWGVRGGLAYSSLVQKIDNNYQSAPVSDLVWRDWLRYLYIKDCRFSRKSLLCIRVVITCQKSQKETVRI